MAGFENDVVYAANLDFSKSDNQSATSTILTNGQLIIGTTVLNAGGTHINIGNLTSPDASVSIGYNSPNITLQAGAAVAITYTEDSGTATPALNNLNVLGGPGVTTSGSGSTITINSVVFTNTTAATLVSDNGYFATAAGTYVLPAVPLQGELIHIVCDTAGAVVVDAPSTHLIRLGNQITSAGGTLTSTAIGDSLTIRYRASTTTWFVIASIGNWTVA